MTGIDEILARTRLMTLRGPATNEAIRRAEVAFGIALPEDYRAFLARHDGGEGAVGAASYLRLWPVESLESEHAAYGFREFCPLLIPFGSNGGGTAYAFDARQSRLPIVQVEFVGPDYELAMSAGETFAEFLLALP